MIFTPYELEVLIHHHGSNARFERWRAGIYKQTIERLEVRGLLVSSKEVDADLIPLNITATDRCKVFIGMLCAVPLPVASWIDPRDGARIGS